MRKIILDLAVTVDGFIEGPNGEIDWIPSDGAMDFGDILNGILVGIDTIFYGRVSYELWGNYQPPEGSDEKLKAAYRSLHSKQKYVFSTTLKQDDTDAIIVDSDIERKVKEILKQPGGNIWLYGGGKLTTTFINLGLIDVYRLAVHPVILGEGKPLFKEIKEKVKLKNTKATIAESGVVLLSYEADK